MNFIDSMIQFILQIIVQIGYPGMAVLMMLESVGIPIPSEVVMPASGWLASDGTFNLVLVTLAGTIGCIIGSSLAYGIGLFGGRPLIIRYGEYVFLNEGHLDAAERWFMKYGAVTIFLTRLMPTGRTYVPILAGMARMKFWPFIILIAIGSAIWCFILAYIGFILGSNWRSIGGAYSVLTITVLVAFGLILTIWIYRRRRRRKVSHSLPSSKGQ